MKFMFRPLDGGGRVDDLPSGGGRGRIEGERGTGAWRHPRQNRHLFGKNRRIPFKMIVMVHTTFFYIILCAKEVVTHLM